MSTGQPGVFAQGTRAHFQLEFTVPKSVTPRQLGAALGRFREPAVTFGGANVVIGFGPALWARLAPDHVPGELRRFRAIRGKRHSAPATQRDLWVWIHGHGHDIALDVARGACNALAKVAKLELELPCFVYRDSRDMLGFIDGTENPPVEDAPAIALLPPGQPGEGGAIALAMKFVHDIEKFQKLTVKAQQGVIGRTKLDSIELSDAVKPATSHIARTVIEEDGEELEIYRRSVPYGTVREHGLYFIAFTNDPGRIDRMLARMYGTADDGLTDDLLQFTRAVTGSYFFVPSLEALSALIER
jgi:putative iron-dependent peroxidase